MAVLLPTPDAYLKILYIALDLILSSANSDLILKQYSLKLRLISLPP